MESLRTELRFEKRSHAESRRATSPVSAAPSPAVSNSSRRWIAGARSDMRHRRDRAAGPGKVHRFALRHAAPPPPPRGCDPRTACRGCAAGARRTPLRPTFPWPRWWALSSAFTCPGMRGHHEDAAADDACLLDGMGDEEHREVGVLPELEELLLHLAPGQRVERRERLVHQQDVRLHRHAPRDGHALLHAAGEHVRVGVLEPVELHLADVLPRDVVGFLAGGAPPPR